MKVSTSTSDHFKVLTKSDATEYKSLRALYVTGAGDLNLEDKLGVTTIFPVTVGQILPVQPVKVMSTSTTATVIGLY